MAAKKITPAVTITQNETPVPTEILAKAIVALSASAQKMLDSGLTRRTIALLLNADIPAYHGLNRQKIEVVLDALPLLAVRHVKVKK